MTCRKSTILFVHCPEPFLCYHPRPTLASRWSLQIENVVYRTQNRDRWITQAQHCSRQPMFSIRPICFDGARVDAVWRMRKRDFCCDATRGSDNILEGGDFDFDEIMMTLLWCYSRLDNILERGDSSRNCLSTSLSFIATILALLTQHFLHVVLNSQGRNSEIVWSCKEGWEGVVESNGV